MTFIPLRLWNEFLVYCSTRCLAAVGPLILIITLRITDPGTTRTSTAELLNESIIARVVLNF
jgi:hypothetical protein